MSGVVPQISLIMGSCAGGAVYSPALTDFVFMVRGSSCMFVTGPDVIRKVTFEEVTQEDLGGSAIHTKKTGVADRAFSDEIDALRQVRKFFSFMPANNKSTARFRETRDTVDRESESLNTLVPHSSSIPYDMYELIHKVCDEGVFFELKPDFAKNIITGFGRIGGHTVGFVANQPLHLAGCLDIDASRKAARFVRFCDAFNIPIVTLIDVPGFMPGVSQEYSVTRNLHDVNDTGVLAYDFHHVCLTLSQTRLRTYTTTKRVLVQASPIICRFMCAGTYHVPFIFRASQGHAPGVAALTVTASSFKNPGGGGQTTPTHLLNILRTRCPRAQRH